MPASSYTAPSISIHAPPRGATKRQARRPRNGFYFNSRPSARGDRAAQTEEVQPLLISIHAPPRGATFICNPVRSLRIYFNSRPSARGDLSACRLPQKRLPFQFTPLREGRLHHALDQGKDVFISIHAPPRGATAKDMQFLQIFCSTLTNQHGLTIVPGNLSRLFW